MANHVCEGGTFEWCLVCGRQVNTIWTENIGLVANISGYTMSTHAAPRAIPRVPRAFSGAIDMRRRMPTATTSHSAFKPVHMPKLLKVQGTVERGVQNALSRMLPYWPAPVTMGFEDLHRQLADEAVNKQTNLRRFVFARMIELFPTRTALAARACGISKRYAAMTLRMWRINKIC